MNLELRISIVCDIPFYCDLSDGNLINIFLKAKASGYIYIHLVNSNSPLLLLLSLTFFCSSIVDTQYNSFRCTA